MYIVAIGWLYVALMMAVAEATNSTGTVLGAIITFLLYGLGPVALVLYLLNTPARRQRVKAREATEMARMAEAETTEVAEATELAKAAAGPAQPSLQPDAGSHAAADAPVTPVRKEP